MSFIGDVAKELLGMFLADARLTITILLLVALVAAAVALGIDPVFAGAFLLLGSLHTVADAALREARRRRR